MSFACCLRCQGFAEFIREHAPDVLCLQECKCSEDEVPFAVPGGYHRAMGVAVQKGYAGTMVLTKDQAQSVVLGIPGFTDTEGRVITVELGQFYIVNTYVPNSGEKLERYSSA